jgi:hypothetical protein
MIGDSQEYERAKEELRHLEEWLERLHIESPLPEKGLTKAGLRKMISRLHEELALYEVNQELHPT